MYDEDTVKTRLSVQEQEFLNFAYNARKGECFVYANTASGKPMSLTRLAHDCFESGLVYLVQKRTEKGFDYVAIKRNGS